VTGQTWPPSPKASNQQGEGLAQLASAVTRRRGVHLATAQRTEWEKPERSQQ